MFGFEGASSARGGHSRSFKCLIRWDLPRYKSGEQSFLLHLAPRSKARPRKAVVSILQTSLLEVDFGGGVEGLEQLDHPKMLGFWSSRTPQGSADYPTT